MTLAEIEREIDSIKRVEKRKEKEKASYDYILADLIGRSISRLYSASAKLPTLEEAYPTIFDQNIKNDTVDNLSAIRFRQFAQSYNKRWRSKK